jgi:hypothetical protein
MTDSQTSVQTNVQQVDLDIDSWLGAPGADSIVTPAKDEKPSIFSQKVQDFSFLDDEDQPSNEETKDKDGNVLKETKPITKEETDNLFKELDEEDSSDGKSKGGRPKK